ncbi:UNVERIFIED_CONTAM: hypothetical protein Slati_1163700 [Sesamum latifolium]|uniref:Isopenicillin N synthase-like Fe(2+) 2OG dioxygenase domain-containing protein n=1 Tax=Sesamum latifolium TaxID=2727402 RepID=A0AAW2XI02_9LAMI
MASLNHSTYLLRSSADSPLLRPTYTKTPARFFYRPPTSPPSSALRSFSVMSSQIPAPTVSTVTISYTELKVVYGEDEIAYQIGETTEILSRGQLCATPHCVRAPKGEAAFGVERSTFALFMQPDWDEKLIFPEVVNIHEFSTPNGSISFGDYTEKVLDKYYDLEA